MSAALKITEDVAMKVRDTVAAGLVSGVGVPKPGEMCVEAAVCYALGLPHGDDPPCVSPALRSLKIRLNDAAWSSTQARAEGLKRLALIQLGSAGELDDKEFRHRVVEMTIRTSVPLALRAAGAVSPKHAEALEAAASRCEREGTKDAASAASAYAADAADAASAAAYATYAATAADAATAAAYASDAAYASADTRTRDSVLADYAERVVQILIDMNAPGAQWLYLLEAAK